MLRYLLLYKKQLAEVAVDNVSDKQYGYLENDCILLYFCIKVNINKGGFKNEKN
ncbi:hypothetical protein [Clostridium estertheticum]|uniref:hypothetical protein n=1 Tax=Clostridium estertheticum TaxID=238834 RepID=UPI001C0E3BD9|nr:hypothetical protein [Clostridium estertheticum]MBU3156320.1 hypothetical protein [Clostridium estertheticum]